MVVGVCGYVILQRPETDNDSVLPARHRSSGRSPHFHQEAAGIVFNKVQQVEIVNKFTNPYLLRYHNTTFQIESNRIFII